MLRYTAGRGDRIKQGHFRAFSVVRSRAVKRGEFCGAGVVTKLQDKVPQRLLDFLVTLLIVFVMSLWDWLLAAWIYEELFDDDSDSTSRDNTHDYDSSYDYDDSLLFVLKNV